MQSENSYRRLSCLQDKAESQKWRNSRPETKNKYDKYAVAVERCGDVVGCLSKRRSARFAKTVSYFPRARNENCVRVKVTGKKVTIGNGEGLQIPCILHFSGEAKFFSKLKNILPELM